MTNASIYHNNIKYQTLRASWSGISLLALFLLCLEQNVNSFKDHKTLTVKKILPVLKLILFQPLE